MTTPHMDQGEALEARLPTPPGPSSDNARAVMIGNRGVDTSPERALRAALHARGLRYFKNRRPVRSLACRADIVFPSQRIAVFVDGCFWHRCPIHGVSPRTNSTYWRAKLDRNVARDRRNDEALLAAGWQVIRVWEHEDPEETADAIARRVARQRRSLAGAMRSR